MCRVCVWVPSADGPCTWCPVHTQATAHGPCTKCCIARVGFHVKAVFRLPLCMAQREWADCNRPQIRYYQLSRGFLIFIFLFLFFIKIYFRIGNLHKYTRPPRGRAAGTYLQKNYDKKLQIGPWGPAARPGGRPYFF